MQYLTAFLVGGLICAVGQILIDKTGLTPAKILTLFVTAGVLLGALGLYQPLLDFAGEGAAAPHGCAQKRRGRYRRGNGPQSDCGRPLQAEG